MPLLCRYAIVIQSYTYTNCIQDTSKGSDPSLPERTMAISWSKEAKSKTPILGRFSGSRTVVAQPWFGNHWMQLLNSSLLGGLDLARAVDQLKLQPARPAVTNH